MEFKEFIGKLASVLRGGDSTDKFARTVFEAIVAPNDAELISAYSAASFKAFFNGTTSISGIAKKINAHTERMEFEAYIETFPDGAVESLCNVFATDIPEINLKNAGEKISQLFVAIITEAAASKRKGQTDGGAAAPNGTANAENDNAAGDFSKYLKAAKEHYSTKKTLLYAENPHAFYDMYVCNDVRIRKDPLGLRDEIVKNADANNLWAKHIIIRGTGGIGKSMFMTHLFLSAADGENNSGALPVLLSLKDYRNETGSVADFITSSVREFDTGISKESVNAVLSQGKFLLLMDGLDEIKSACMEKFEKEIDSFTKACGNNAIVITSRPINKFISYSRFLICDLMPLDEEQSVELVEKLDFWNVDAKRNFVKDLRARLYHTHREFASNPLLLTIMLMTYSTFGEIPAKMHVFYSKAYETMARLHDASKGSFKRHLHTGLTPEEFSKYFAQFCARTYKDEILEFDQQLFCSYMEKVLKSKSEKLAGISPKDFLSDLTDNLCIMYREGEKYYFIHRSFQEYFAAVFFASEFDDRLVKVGRFFGSKNDRSGDNSFDMLYDMIPQKVERFVFLPYLDEIFEGKGMEGYWSFLEKIYGYLYYSCASDFDTPPTGYSRPFLYERICGNAQRNKQVFGPAKRLHLNLLFKTDDIRREVYTGHCRPYSPTDDDIYMPVELPVHSVRKFPEQFPNVRKLIEDDGFFLMQEYRDVRKYYEELKNEVQNDNDSDDLFD